MRFIDEHFLQPTVSAKKSSDMIFTFQERINAAACLLYGDDHRRRFNEATVRASRVRARMVFAKDTVASSVVETHHRIDVVSYGIDCTWNLLRHVYLSYTIQPRRSANGGDEPTRKIEIHAGMSNLESCDDGETCTDEVRQRRLRNDDDDDDDDGGGTITKKELMYSTPNYYGYGRCEGYMLLCDQCATVALDDAETKNNNFFLPFNNCDTIVPFVYQTPLIWFSLLGFTVGAIISTQTFNAFAMLMFMPVLAFLFTVFYNKIIRDERERSYCLLRRCPHAVVLNT